MRLHSLEFILMQDIPFKPEKKSCLFCNAEKICYYVPKTYINIVDKIKFFLSKGRTYHKIFQFYVLVIQTFKTRIQLFLFGLNCKSLGTIQFFNKFTHQCACHSFKLILNISICVVSCHLNN